VDRERARLYVSTARIARLATVTSSGDPHVVPCCFVLLGDTIYSAVDTKPKSTLALRRLDNLRANPRAALLVDHYEAKWSRLWWVRVDGAGRIVETEGERKRARQALTDKYEQYEENPPQGDVIAIGIETWRSWPDR
jgi:PPOX class probable F420-dependent enzyme